MHRASARFQYPMDFREELVFVLVPDVPDDIARNHVIKTALGERQTVTAGLIDFVVYLSGHLQQRQHGVDADHFSVLAKIVTTAAAADIEDQPVRSAAGLHLVTKDAIAPPG